MKHIYIYYLYIDCIVIITMLKRLNLTLTFVYPTCLHGNCRLNILHFDPLQHVIYVTGIVAILAEFIYIIAFSPVNCIYVRNMCSYATCRSVTKVTVKVIEPGQRPY